MCELKRRALKRRGINSTLGIKVDLQACTMTCGDDKVVELGSPKEEVVATVSLKQLSRYGL